MMTRKDYIAVSTILNRYQNNFPVEISEFKWLVVDFMELFEKDNPNFDRAKFKEAVYSTKESMVNN